MSKMLVVYYAVKVDVEAAGCLSWLACKIMGAKRVSRKRLVQQNDDVDVCEAIYRAELKR